MFKSIYKDELTTYYGLRSTALSDSALKHELCYLKRFDKCLLKQSNVRTITDEFMTLWVDSLLKMNNSIAGEIICVRKFLKHLQTLGYDVFLPTIPKVHDNYIPYIFSEDELTSIFNAADNIIQTAHNRDPYLVIEFPVILRLLYSCGSRIGETLKLKVSEVDLENGVLLMLNTKGNKHRYVPMSEGMTEILRDYCMAMGITNKSESWLFPSGKDPYNHISDRSVKHCFEYILRDTNIFLPNRKKHERGPCLHFIRHVFALKSFAHAERNGRHLNDTIPYLSIYLGHSSLNETEKYLKFSNELFPDSIYEFGEYMEDLMPEVDYGEE